MQTSLLHLGSQTGPVTCWLALPSQVACYLPHGHTGISSNKFLACLIMSRDPLLVAPRLKHQRTAMSPQTTSQTASVLTIICMQNEEMIIKVFFFLMACRGHQLYQNTKRFLNILGILYMGSCLSLTTVLQYNMLSFNYHCPVEESEVPKIYKKFPRRRNDVMVSWGFNLDLTTLRVFREGGLQTVKPGYIQHQLLSFNQSS